MRARNSFSRYFMLVACSGPLILICLSLGTHQLSAQTDDESPEFAWIEELRNSSPLDQELLNRYQELVSQLDADSYREREDATCELLLMPQRIAVDLFELREAESPELRHRVAFLLARFSEDPQPFAAYVARRSAIPTNYLSAQFSNHGVEEILNRLDLEHMTAHPGVWSLLFRYSSTQEERERVHSMLASVSEQDPTVILYRGLLDHHAAHPQARSNLIDFIPESAGIELVLAVAQVSANDQNPIVQSARNRLLRRLRTSLNIDDMLVQYRASSDLPRKELLLELLVLENATPEQRSTWLKLGEEASDAALRTSFMQMAAREGMHEVLESTLVTTNPSARFSLLSAVGKAEHWQRALFGEQAQSLQAATWLPYSTLSVEEQIAHLLRLIETGTDQNVRSVAASMLSGYGRKAVVIKALEWLETTPDLSPFALELVAQHAWHLPEIIDDPFATEWFSQAAKHIQARVLIWYGGEASDQALYELAIDADPKAARIALDALAERRSSWLGCQLAATRNVHKVDFVPASLLASFDISADRVFEQLIQHFKDNPDFNIGVERESEQARQALSLALFKHEGFRKALKKYRTQIRNHYALLALFNDEGEADRQAEQSALDDRPQDLLYFAKVLLSQGREELIVDAIINTLKFGPLPNDLDPMPLTQALASDVASRRIRSILDGLSKKSAQEVHLSLLTLPLSLNRITRPYLDILASAGMIKGTDSYRRLLLLGASASPDLDHSWLNVRREIWESAEKERVEQALSFLEVVVDKNVHALITLGTDSQLESNKSQLDIRLPALTAAARLGSRSALIAAGNAIYAVGRNGSTLAPNGVATTLDSAFRLDRLCRDAPKTTSPLKAQMIWRSTRFAWSFDSDSQSYTLETP